MIRAVVVGLGLVLAGPVWAQSTTKICVPIPAQPGGVASCQDVTAAFPLPTAAASVAPPAAVAQVPLDVSTVTTGGVAVTALAAGNRASGGFIQNPPTATINLCINEMGTASGTTSAGNTTCIVAGQGYVVTAGTGAVSVVAADSAHAFSGYGLK